MKILGIDPGLRITGWGIIDFDGYRLKYVSHGIIETDSNEKISCRLSYIYKSLSDIIEEYRPDEFSIEETFVNMNPTTSLKLGMARGAAICCIGVLGYSVFEYTPNKIKKTIVGAGHASKDQISVMVQKLLNCGKVTLDAADALAIAICHAHHKTSYMVQT